MAYWLLGSGGLLLLSSVALLWWSLVSRKGLQELTRQRMQDILRTEAIRETRQSALLASLLARLDIGGQKSSSARRQAWRQEMRVLMVQAGIYNPEARVLLKSAMVLVPFVAALMAFVLILGAGQLSLKAFSLMFIAFSLGVLLPRYALRCLASRRREAIIDEVPILVRMVSVLFEAGLSLEGALKMLRDEARGILPNLSVEIERMLARIAAGMDRVEALEQMARGLEIQEVTDAVAVLGHTATTGGSVRQSLARIADLIEDRNRTKLRERVGKLSAQMTVVMMLFLFPALFIFLAGPGFVAISGALGSMR